MTKARRTSDWGEFHRMSLERHVTPMLYCSLGHAGAWELVPPELRDLIHRLYLQVAAQNLFRLRRMLEVDQLLRSQGVLALYLKGSSLVMAGDYTDPGQRMFSDLDVLVEESAKPEVRKAFAAANRGWEELPSISDREWDDTKFRDDFGSLIEVHWRMKPLNAVPGTISSRRLWSHAEEVVFHGHRALIPSREDRYIQAAIHATAHHSFNSSLIFTAICDLVHLTRTGARLDQARMVEELKKERLLEYVVVATETAWLITGHPPLAETLRAFHELEPKVKLKTARMSMALYRMLLKPWVFSSRAETRLLAKRVKGNRLWRLFLLLLPRRFSMTKKLEVQPGNDAQQELLIARYKRRLWDLDFLRYFRELRRFYRKIDYINID